MKLKIFLAAFILTPILFSCSENSSDLDPNCSLENSMMLKVGNYWVYNTTELDQNGNAIAGTEGIDSSFVSGIQVVEGKQAFQMVTHSRILNNDSVYIDSTYYAQEVSRVYLPLRDSFKSIIYQIGLNEWGVIADCNHKQWVGADKKYKGADYTSPGPDGRIDTSFIESHLKVDGVNAGLKKIKVDTTLVTALLFENKQSLILNLFSTNPDALFEVTGTKEVSIVTDSKYLIADGIGIVQHEMSGYKAGYLPYENGTRKTLIRYSVK